MISGLVLIDKPEGWTSHDVVARVRRIVGQREVGHTGTLDPFATGLMIVVLGEATKLSDFFRDADKSYEVTLRLGVVTDTLDMTGTVVQESSVAFGAGAVQSAVEALQGHFTWPVPAFSAVKRDGQKLYDLARSGRAVETPLRPMTFSDVRFVSYADSTAVVRLRCSAGSYVRSWVAKVGESLGCGAVAVSLRRLQSSSFDVAKALTLESLESVVGAGQLRSHPSFVDVDKTLPRLPFVTVRDREERLLVNGTISFDLSRRLNEFQKEAYSSQTARTIRVLSARTDRMVALLEARPGEGLKIRRVLREQA
jgi:tRNA pseudouridine55 synthase